ncbi:MAG TPA: hypothetical protein PLE29_05715 [Saprospiraceae bacterium]|nr:hypothetical protein [Saprospiraceae bacterium]
MKSLKIFGIMMLFASFLIVSCSDDEKATCTDGVKNQDETAIDCGGVCTACATCNDGIQNGTETGIDCGGTCTACLVGAQGKWKSYPVAPILANFADSIIAVFNTNNTYSVDQWSKGAKVQLTGTYGQTKSSVGNIYTIVLNQSTPTVLTAEGIFEVASDNKSMKYEVAQTQPTIAGVTAPTAAGGFGSTSGGAFGIINIQNYTRVK